MTMEEFINLYFGNVSTIIEVLTAIVLLLIAIMVVFDFVDKKQIETGEKSSELEETLRRVLESTEVKASAVSGATVITNNMSSAPILDADGNPIEPGSVAEENALKQKLSEKETEIMALRDQLTSLEKSGGSSGNTELEAKLKDLEAKLQEYEIIEDDIANLSLYKEENAKLKEEIEKLRAGGATEAVASPPPVVESVEAQAAAEPKVDEPKTEEAVADSPKEEEAADDDIMAEFAAAVEEQKATEAPKEAVEEEAADDDIMAEFAAAVEEQKATESGEIENNEEAEAEAVEESMNSMEDSEEAAEESSSSVADDDIMAEFAAAVDEQKSTESTEKEVEESDEDIMAEFAAAVEEQNAVEEIVEKVEPNIESDDEVAEMATSDSDSAPSQSSEEEVSAVSEEPAVSVDSEMQVEESSKENPMDEMMELDAAMSALQEDTAPDKGEKDLNQVEEVDLSSLISEDDLLAEEDKELSEKLPLETKEDELSESTTQEAEESIPEEGSVDDLLSDFNFDDEESKEAVSEEVVQDFNKAVQEQRELKEQKEKEILEKFQAKAGNSQENATEGLVEEAAENQGQEGFLSQAMDTDKLLDEVGALEEHMENSNGDDEENDVGDKLIAEFEQFSSDDEEDKN